MRNSLYHVRKDTVVVHVWQMLSPIEGGPNAKKGSLNKIQQAEHLKV